MFQCQGPCRAFGPQREVGEPWLGPGFEVESYMGTSKKSGPCMGDAAILGPDSVPLTFLLHASKLPHRSGLFAGVLRTRALPLGVYTLCVTA